MGHAEDCTVKVEKTSKFKNGKRKYKVTIKLKDLYDFSPPDKNDEWWIKALKNAGVSAQNSSQVTPYWWKIKFTYAIYRKD